MRKTAIALFALVLAAGVANATRPVAETWVIERDDALPGRTGVCWLDDMEDGDNGWTHGDWTATGSGPQFHVDSYMAYGGAGITIDNVQLEGTEIAVESRSWGSIKAMYR